MYYAVDYALAKERFGSEEMDMALSVAHREGRNFLLFPEDITEKLDEELKSKLIVFSESHYFS